jgi:hypothetical protein
VVLVVVIVPAVVPDVVPARATVIRAVCVVNQMINIRYRL